MGLGIGALVAAPVLGKTFSELVPAPRLYALGGLPEPILAPFAIRIGEWVNAGKLGRAKSAAPTNRSAPGETYIGVALNDARPGEEVRVAIQGQISLAFGTQVPNQPLMLQLSDSRGAVLKMLAGCRCCT